MKITLGIEDENSEWLTIVDMGECKERNCERCQFRYLCYTQPEIMINDSMEFERLVEREANTYKNGVVYTCRGNKVVEGIWIAA